MWWLQELVFYLEVERHYELKARATHWVLTEQTLHSAFSNYREGKMQQCMPEHNCRMDYMKTDGFMCRKHECSCVSAVQCCPLTVALPLQSYWQIALLLCVLQCNYSAVILFQHDNVTALWIVSLYLGFIVCSICCLQHYWEYYCNFKNDNGS